MEWRLPSRRDNGKEASRLLPQSNVNTKSIAPRDDALCISINFLLHNFNILFIFANKY